MNKKPIYIITSVEGKLGGSCRCWRFFHLLKDAKMCVKENRGEMNECFYEYLIIEEINEKMYNLNKEYWYRWQNKDRKWIEVEKPEIFKGVICFGMG